MAMSASKDKRSSGFKTSSSELQGRFDQLFKGVEDKEKAWAEFVKWTQAQSKDTGARVTTEASLGNLGMVTVAESAMIMSYIGRLGITLAKIEKRLVNIEKSIERLHFEIQ
jgi:hypothetical protein